MSLTKKQELTIKHLKEWQNITSEADIIYFCLKKLAAQPKLQRRKYKYAGEIRRHGEDHYRGIIQYCMELEASKKKTRLQQLIENEKKLGLAM